MPTAHNSAGEVSQMRNAILRNVLHIMLAVFVALVLAGTVLAQQQNDRKPASNLLVRVLQAKGILTDEEAARVSQASTADEAEGRLARLLLSKGIIRRASRLIMPLDSSRRASRPSSRLRPDGGICHRTGLCG